MHIDQRIVNFLEGKGGRAYKEELREYFSNYSPAYLYDRIQVLKRCGYVIEMGRLFMLRRYSGERDKRKWIERYRECDIFQRPDNKRYYAVIDGRQTKSRAAIERVKEDIDGWGKE